MDEYDEAIARILGLIFLGLVIFWALIRLVDWLVGVRA